MSYVHSSATASLLRLLEIEQPIIQAPMAGTSTPAMAAAVTNAGGLGSLGVGAMSPTTAANAISSFGELSRGSLNVNVFCHRPPRRDPVREAAWRHRLKTEFEKFGAAPPSSLNEIYRSFLVDDAMLDIILDARPRVVSFHFGAPNRDIIHTLHDAGIILFGTATNVAEACSLAAAGIDAIVAQGYEAGGHRGIFDPMATDDRLSTIALTRLLVMAFDLPVISAGGIMDGAGIAAVLKLGAAAAQLGTAFVGTDESAADQGFRAALFSDAAHHTVMTRAISGRPARCLANRFTELGASIDPDEIPDYPLAYDAGKALNAAAKDKGDYGFGAQWAGQGAPLARAMDAAKMVAVLSEELEQALTSA